jgi:sulfate adenylyltransferase
MTQPNLAPIPELYVSADSAQKLKAEAGNMPSWDLTPRQICDLELLMNGGFYPLKGFLTEADYNSVVDDMHLTTGDIWPIPVNLDVSQAFADTIEPGQDIALRDQEGVILAILSITDKWTPNKSHEAEKVSAPAATPRTSCGPFSASWAGAASSPSRPATRCTGRIRN